ncbi:hypothetical protein Ciccas_012948 [Cichlidogyrus casuarinus]|uniref:Uncharacterized protein n=1 Tax=Cichlidogyrus casuarinus TaxID=1844966 RepID=A0ABD2PLZ5_9PLAT
MAATTSDYHSITDSNSSNAKDDSALPGGVLTDLCALPSLDEAQDLESLRLQIDFNNFVVEKPISGNAILSQPLSNWSPATLLDENSNIRLKKVKNPLIVFEETKDGEQPKSPV